MSQRPRHALDVVEPSKKLIRLLCSGENILHGDFYPVLVLSPLGKSVNGDLCDRFRFINTFPWKAVFDFDSGGDGTVYKFVDEQLGLAVTANHVDIFDTHIQGSGDELKNLQDTFKDTGQQAWLFGNGFDVLDKETLKLKEWKMQHSEGFKECLRFVAQVIPRERALVVFLVMSEDNDVMMTAAEDFCLKFQGNWMVVAESQKIASKWKHVFLQRELVDLCTPENDFESKCVVGMPWEHVNDVVMRLCGQNLLGSCQLPSSTGTEIMFPNKKKNYLVDLQVLGCNECANTELVVNKKLRAADLDTFKCDIEQRFYRGQQVDWWNFFFLSHVLQRELFRNLFICVSNSLERENEQPVIRINLFHHPSAGGTTIAKQVLWELRSKFRCAVVTKITENTCDQVFQLWSFNDPNPRPVLLLLDNYPDEVLGDFMTALLNRATKATRTSDTQPSVLFVLLVCQTKLKLPKKEEQRMFVLKSFLSDGERLWLLDKYAQLEEQFRRNKMHDPQNFISFNIMKENFDQEYLKSTVLKFTSDISNPEERKLLKYISLINTFDIHGRALPVASFDCLMARQKWETCMSEPLKVLLNETTLVCGGAVHSIKIINSRLSKHILDVLMNEGGRKELEGHVMLEFLGSKIFYSTEDVVEKLLGVIRNLMKNRRRKLKFGMIYETKFSPLIQTIVDDKQQGVPTAADVLVRVFELSEDLFVAQQIARLYIYSRNWKEATKYGEMIATENPSNSFLLDTFAQVYKAQVVEAYHVSIRMKGTNQFITAKQANEVVGVAFRAIDAFKREQEVSETEHFTLTNNNAGYFGEIATVARLLDYMTSVEGLQGASILQKFLVDEKFIPQQVRCWEPDKIQRIKSLEPSVMKTISRLEDEFLQLKSEYSDDALQRRFHDQQDYLLKHKESIDNYFCEGSSEVPSGYSKQQAAGFYRRQIRKLGGNTLRGLLDIRHNDDGRKLHTILNMVAKNIGMEYETPMDLQIYIGASITVCTLGVAQRAQVSHEQLARLSADLYQRTDHENGLDLEPYLFATMLNWPLKDLPFRPFLPAQLLPEVLSQWKNTFFRKYPRKHEESKKETTFFFLANGENMNAFAYEGELRRPQDVLPSDVFWSSEQVTEKLKKLTGVLRRSELLISYVRIVVEQDGNKSTFDIPTSRPMNDAKMYNKNVTCFVGFSWSGPKAYNVCLFDSSASSITAVPTRAEPQTPTELAPDIRSPSEFPDLPYSAGNGTGTIPSMSFYPKRSVTSKIYNFEDHHMFSNDFNSLRDEVDELKSKLSGMKKTKTTAAGHRKMLMDQLAIKQKKIQDLIRRRCQETDVFRYHDY